jgi:hypothetical protein
MLTSQSHKYNKALIKDWVKIPVLPSHYFFTGRDASLMNRHYDGGSIKIPVTLDRIDQI